MKTVVSAFALVLSLAATPAVAQMAPGMGGGMGSALMGGSAPQPRQHVPDIAPAGVPGAASAPLATGPNLQKPITGDPTTALFTAITKNDYSAAQDAVSRGANLNTQNPLGETPLDMAVALNRSAITFMLLAARNEEGGTAAAAAARYHAPTSTVAVSDRTPAPRALPVPVMSNNPGVPDPAAGFLGFSPQK